jgi:polyisoprenoid-binding protein YceI
MNMEQRTEAIEHKLRAHLLGPDFFDADQFPTARFEITRVEPYYDHQSVANANYLVSGNLTLKNITKNISFPASLTINNQTVTGTANFNMNRTWWNMNYGNSHSLGNKFISETVNIQLRVKTVPLKP